MQMDIQHSVRKNRWVLLALPSLWCGGYLSVEWMRAERVEPGVLHTLSAYLTLGGVSAVALGICVARRLWARLPTARITPVKYPDDVVTIALMVVPALWACALSVLSGRDTQSVVLVTTVVCWLLGLGAGVYQCARGRV